MNGQQVLAEAIADNGGVKLAYDAYQEYVRQNGEELRLPKLKLSPNQVGSDVEKEVEKEEEEIGLQS